MSASQPAPKMLAMEALTHALDVFDFIEAAQALAEEGNQSQAVMALESAAAACAACRPVIRAVIATQQQAAQALNLAQDPSVRVLSGVGAICSIGKPQPHPDAANAHASPPLQPSDGVA